MPFILVTGGNGFLAAHIIDQLLEAGHHVRGTVRSPKLEIIRGAYAAYGPQFEAAAVDDVATSDLTEAFQDVCVVMHVAARAIFPFSEASLHNTVKGTQNILQAAHTANVKKIIVTSSIWALFGPEDKWTDITVDETSWNRHTKESATQPGAEPIMMYVVAKTLSEQAVWSFAREHPDIDVTTILPSFCYGPHSPHEVYPFGNFTTKAYTNRTFYWMINGFEGRPFAEYAQALDYTVPAFTHVLDAALSHVLALDVPPSPRPKRFIVIGGYLILNEAVKHIAKARPELKDRLPVVEEGFKDERPYVKFDTSLTENILEMKTLKTWQEAAEETIDVIIAMERQVV